MKGPIRKATSLGQEAVNTILQPFFKQRTHAVVHPFRVPEKEKKEPQPFHIQVYDFSANHIEEKNVHNVEECFDYRDKASITWLNLEGIHKAEVEAISGHYGIHQLLQDDITSYGQRPKLDEVNDIIYVLMNMLYYNEKTSAIEQEQISIVLGKNFVISFQEDARRDVFNPIRQKLKHANTKLRQYPADHLFYTMIDIIVDSYFHVIEKVGEQIEKAESDLMNSSSQKTFHQINLIRKDLILLKRNTTPVRDLVAGLLRSDSELLNDNTTKYYKDVHDHIMQANDLVDNYRDLVNTLQDMYFNNINLRMNEVMKTLAILTSVMAPATVIGGIFGMNFDVIPYAHHKWGFYGTVLFMFTIPIAMMWWFQRRGWFQYRGPNYGK
ncbi:MAG TPA: magnesium/cobalt transporter CorA [Phnomibacter sp.]|nr:magnesium/cobalt transporter CorA [Phnomibacter sp.]